MKFKRFLIGLTALALCSMLTSCGGGDNADNVGGIRGTDNEYSSRIYLLASQSGRLAPARPGGASGSSRVLILENPGPEALWYTDRPGRETGSTPLQNYVNDTAWRDAYGRTNPNATVQFQLTGSGDLEGVYVSLSSPSYDEKSNTLTFDAEILNHTLAQTLPDILAFTHVTLNVLNNAVDDQEVSSYIQYAGQAFLQPAAAPGQVRVVLSNAAPDMFWVDNAPGRHSDSRPMSYFFPQWPYIFGDDPPNAVLFGTTAAGDQKLYFLTLLDPVYDESLGQVSYAATLLNQTAGALETLNKAILSIDSGVFSRFPMPGKGTGYQAFGKGFDPSTAHESYIYYGSDIARKQMGSLWGTQSYLSQRCEPDCRNDLQRMKTMGVNLIRLYDWDTRNDHSQFLDYADSLNIKVVVPISNWLPTQTPEVWDKEIPNYFKHGNFGDSNGKDWHPAVAGVIISNELDMENEGKYYDNVIGLVARFIREADERGFSKSVPVGAPVTFVPRGEPFGPDGVNLPGWNQFNRLLTDARTAQYKDRLMLCPNTYNDRTYLFVNAEGTKKGWVPLTYEKFGVPILFTEIGLSRAESYYTPTYVQDQLRGVIEYQKDHQEQILGAIHFQFDDKVWKQTDDDTDTEGAFGAFHHGPVLKQIQTVTEDFDFDVSETKGYGILAIDRLDPTSTYTQVVEAYK